MGSLRDRVLTSLEFKETEARALEARLVALGGLATALSSGQKKIAEDIMSTLKEYSNTLFGSPDEDKKKVEKEMRDYEEIMTMSPKVERRKDGSLVLTSLF